MRDVEGLGDVEVGLASIAPACTVWDPSERVLIVDESLPPLDVVAAVDRWMKSIREHGPAGTSSPGTPTGGGSQVSA